MDSGWRDGRRTIGRAVLCVDRTSEWRSEWRVYFEDALVHGGAVNGERHEAFATQRCEEYARAAGIAVPDADGGERARIVAWLRRCAEPQWAAVDFADAIERGEHLK